MLYMFHFHEKYYHAGHYLGCTDSISRRIHEHLTGTGNALIKEIVDAGIGFSVYIIDEDGDFYAEKLLKSQKNNKRFCPVCNSKQVGRLVYRKENDARIRNAKKFVDSTDSITA